MYRYAKHCGNLILYFPLQYYIQFFYRQKETNTIGENINVSNQVNNYTIEELKILTSSIDN